MEKRYTLSDLTSFTGAKRRSVQLWAEAGVLRAMSDTERAGSGTHRVFDVDEVIVACVVHAFALNGLPIGRLLRVSLALRKQLASKEIRKLIESAAYGGVAVYLVNLGDSLFFFKLRDKIKAMASLIDGLEAGVLSATVISLNKCFAQVP